MIRTLVVDTRTVTCPVCSKVLGRSRAGLRGHFNSHKKKNLMTHQDIIEIERKVFPQMAVRIDYHVEKNRQHDTYLAKKNALK